MKNKLVLLRPLKRSDSPLLYEWITDRELHIFNAAYRPVSEQEHEKWLDSILLGRKDIVLFVIEEKTTGEALGSCQLMNVNAVHRNAELQIRIGSNKQGKGFGSEAVKQLVEFGFRDMNLHRIYLHVFSTNSRAIHTYKKHGFKEEGRLRQAAFIDGQYVDLLVMGILREEFIEK